MFSSSAGEQLIPGWPGTEAGGAGGFSGMEPLENGLGFFCLVLPGLLQAQGLFEMGAS